MPWGHPVAPIFDMEGEGKRLAMLESHLRSVESLRMSYLT